MPRIVRCGLIQAKNELSPKHSLPQIKKAMIDKHLKLIDQAAKKRAQILCCRNSFMVLTFAGNRTRGGMSLPSACRMGPQLHRFRKSAANNGWWLVVRFMEE